MGPARAEPARDRASQNSQHVGHIAPGRLDGLTIDLEWGRRRPLATDHQVVGAVAALLLPSASVSCGSVDDASSTGLASYLPLPTRGGAGILLPVKTRAAASAGLVLRSPARDRRGRRLAYGAAGLALRTGLLQRVLGARVHVRIATGADIALAEVSLTHRVSELVGETVNLAARVGRPDPHRTVTMHAVADDGRLIAFVKVTSSPLSCAQLETEARALKRLSHSRLPTVRVPHLIHNGHWNGLGLLVVSPMDLDGSDQPTLERPPPAAAMLEVAGSGLRSTSSLQESDYWARTRRRLLELRPALPAAQGAWTVAWDLYDGLTSVAATTMVDFGGWHGDWLPWNLGWRAGRLMTWDWEYWDVSVPVGFDMLHFFGGTAFFRDGSDAGSAMRFARAKGGAVLEAAGFEPFQVDVIHALYVLEFLMRRLDIAAHGGGHDDSRVFPSLAPAAFEALATASVATVNIASRR